MVCRWSRGQGGEAENQAEESQTIKGQLLVEDLGLDFLGKVSSKSDFNRPVLGSLEEVKTEA